MSRVDVRGGWQGAGPFLRGVGWRDGDRCVRADPADGTRLPLDTWERARMPVGVRLGFEAEGPFEVRYRAEAHGTVDALLTGTRGWQALRPDGDPVCEVPEVPEEGERTIRVEWPGGAGELYPPEGYGPVLLGVRGARPAPSLPRWLVYGDSITEGWTASRPALAWPAVAGRALGLDPVNLGYAGAGRGELAMAEQLARLECVAVTLAFGTNCWTGVAHSAPLLYEVTRAFLALVRCGHPRTPLLVVSPVPRPGAEETPNALGATLGDLRTAVESAVGDRIAAGDTHLALLPGAPLLGPEHLPDGLHPDDTGHALMATAVARALGALVGTAAA
ncbi:SGNH/GDSL hydrolase family protein [Streptomyces iconiensis]|uniref:SGNH/GDSL hydrolase family protein n=1 Tax=Streptomyces iconiensis TaxID=1384038 RepID=A0ABT6ZTL8_9ACTN|nr:SGNH/GDSL hydrolase family protein [Streptomyces iconiensis]MDJ1132408.1 SGNH/GDSL hydrolase family protein [Streptomyces iconiensis]